MFDDKESDFWKEKLNDIQHKNMTRAGSERLIFSEVIGEIKKFEETHPELAAKMTDNVSYITWEIPVTATVKLRVFFQSQIKLSLMQTTGAEPVKICDAKFPYNPFPEIEAFVKLIPDYKKELEQLLKKHLNLTKKQKVAGEFIKAYVQEKISTVDYLWQLLPEKESYLLKLTSTRTSEEKRIPLTLENFQSELSPYIP